MPNWGEVLKEIQSESVPPGPVDIVRRRYIQKLHKKTKRNIIVYYSGWLQRNESAVRSAIYDDDINSFMTVINKLNPKKGLDLLLHTPGGNITATEALVKYLRKKFNRNIRCFIPQLAMSAGTMIACACKEIYMGKQSSIGPIDPQFGNRAAFAVLRDYQNAVIEIQKNPSSIPLWQTIFQQDLFDGLLRLGVLAFLLLLGDGDLAAPAAQARCFFHHVLEFGLERFDADGQFVHRGQRGFGFVVRGRSLHGGRHDVGDGVGVDHVGFLLI